MAQKEVEVAVEVGVEQGAARRREHHAAARIDIGEGGVFEDAAPDVEQHDGAVPRVELVVGVHAADHVGVAIVVQIPEQGEVRHATDATHGVEVVAAALGLIDEDAVGAGARAVHHDAIGGGRVGGRSLIAVATVGDEVRIPIAVEIGCGQATALEVEASAADAHGVRRVDETRARSGSLDTEPRQAGVGARAIGGDEITYAQVRAGVRLEAAVARRGHPIGRGRDIRRTR